MHDGRPICCTMTVRRESWKHAVNKRVPCSHSEATRGCTEVAYNSAQLRKFRVQAREGQSTCRHSAPGLCINEKTQKIKSKVAERSLSHRRVRNITGLEAFQHLALATSTTRSEHPTARPSHSAPVLCPALAFRFWPSFSVKRQVSEQSYGEFVCSLVLMFGRSHKHQTTKRTNIGTAIQ